MGFGKGLFVGTIIGAVGTIAAALIADEIIDGDLDLDFDDADCDKTDSDDDSSEETERAPDETGNSKSKSFLQGSLIQMLKKAELNNIPEETT